MIAFLEGVVQSTGDSYLVVRVGGIGLRVFTTLSLCRETQVGDIVTLHTYLVVREDVLALYGFAHEEECDYFALLLGVNGVGPRLALGILSTLSVDAIRRAVLSEQVDLFNRVPGVGRKTAQKVLLHLQGKVKGGLEELGGPFLDVDSEVIDALTGLGYSVVEAQAALQSLPRDAPKDVENRLRMVLQYFNK